MAAVRASGRPVVLVGDLNMSYRPQDRHYSWSSLHLDQLSRIHMAKLAASEVRFSECTHCGDTNMCDCPRCRRSGVGGCFVCEHFGSAAARYHGIQRLAASYCQQRESLLGILATRRVVSKMVKSSTSKTGQVEKYRMVVTVPVPSATPKGNIGIVTATTAATATAAAGKNTSGATVSSNSGGGCSESGSNSSGGGTTVHLGSLSETAARAERSYSIDARTVTDEETGEIIEVSPAGTLCVCDYSELMDKALRLPLKPGEERLLAALCPHPTADTAAPAPAPASASASASALALALAPEQAGSGSDARHATATTAIPCNNLPQPSWMTKVLQFDGMIDAFAHYHPRAQGRFTCWDQYRNQRYANVGSRIDFTLVDNALFAVAARRGDAGLYNPGAANGTGDDAEHAGQLAATANGAWQPVPFEGGGMEISRNRPQSMETQFRPPHTGIVYTPPNYSDHVGVSLVLEDAAVRPETGMQLSNDSATRGAMPHRKQPRIS
eukprot:UC1_evm1s97